MDITTKYIVEEGCMVDLSHYYSNGRPALIIVNKDGSHLLTASVNLPDEQLGDNEIFIKDYSENEGILQSLIDAGVVIDTGEIVARGFVDINKVQLCDILPELDYSVQKYEPY